MEQLRQLGEAVGSINALMAFEPELLIPRQCRLLANACAGALGTVTGEVRAHLRFDERGTKWRTLEAPLRELHRALRDAEGYIRLCLDPRGSWWARAAATAHSTDCVEHHLHDVLWCVSVAIEAVDAAGETAGSDPDEHARARLALAKKYDADMLEPRTFQLALGKEYLVSRELVARMEMARKEDGWLLSQLLDEMKGSKHEHRLAELLVAPRGRLHRASVLLGGDYSVRRRLGGGLKEAQWMGESFAVKHFIGNGEAFAAEAALLSSVAHPNVAHAAYCFHDDEKKEYFIVMDQLMPRDLGSYVKEVSCPRRRIPFQLVVAVDIMLQIARGMEYLHGRGIRHGELNPSNVLVKPPPQPDGGYVHVKVAGFGQSGIKAGAAKAAANGNGNNANGDDSTCIWHAPEVLKPEGAAPGDAEKADVYSFSMICFELLTGKVPFDDSHLQGDKMSKNICAGERPLFPIQTPKHLTALTKRCWHADPAQRPAFSSVCRLLRYIKRFLVMNPEQQEPPVDYLDIETQLLRRLPAWQRGEAGARVSEVPFQMFAYRVVEREKTAGQAKGKASDSGSEANSLYGDENGMCAMSPDHLASVSNGGVRLDSSDGKKPPSVKKADGKPSRQTGPQQKVKPASMTRTPQATRKTLGVKTEGA